MSDQQAFVDALAAAVKAGETYPRFPEGLDLASGEALQADLAAAMGGVGGMKAGIGEAPIQAALGLEGPLLGYLYAERILEPGTELAADSAGRIECELGLVLDASGTITAVRPVVEVVRPDFAARDDMTGANLAACNVSADRVIVGEQRSWAGEPTGTVAARRDGEVILEADLASSLGGPSAAAAWLVDETSRRGIELDDELLFVTGTCGKALPLEPGSYTVDFDGLGSVEFSVR